MDTSGLCWSSRRIYKYTIRCASQMQSVQDLMAVELYPDRKRAFHKGRGRIQFNSGALHKWKNYGRIVKWLSFVVETENTLWHLNIFLAKCIHSSTEQNNTQHKSRKAVYCFAPFCTDLSELLLILQMYFFVVSECLASGIVFCV